MSADPALVRVVETDRYWHSATEIARHVAARIRVVSSGRPLTIEEFTSISNNSARAGIRYWQVVRG